MKDYEKDKHYKHLKEIYYSHDVHGISELTVEDYIELIIDYCDWNIKKYKNKDEKGKEILGDSWEYWFARMTQRDYQTGETFVSLSIKEFLKTNRSKKTHE